MIDTFHIELSLARMTVGLAHRNRDDLGVPGTLWQVQRLADEYHRNGDHDRAAKLERLLKWYDDGGPSGGDVVLSEATK